MRLSFLGSTATHPPWPLVAAFLGPACTMASGVVVAKAVQVASYRKHATPYTALREAVHRRLQAHSTTKATTSATHRHQPIGVPLRVIGKGRGGAVGYVGMRLWRVTCNGWRPRVVRSTAITAAAAQQPAQAAAAALPATACLTQNGWCRMCSGSFQSVRSGRERNLRETHRRRSGRVWQSHSTERS